MRHSILTNRRGFGFVLTILAGSAPVSSAHEARLSIFVFSVGLSCLPMRDGTAQTPSAANRSV